MNIIVVDDHPLVRQGLVAVIAAEEDMKLVGEASTKDEALKLLIKANPCIALIDLRLGDSSGLKIVTVCKEKYPDCRCIILTSSVEREDFSKAREIGVDGYVLKEAFPEEILTAIRLVSRGRKYYDPAMIDCMMTKDKDDEHVEQLTPRELEVLRALGEGLNNKEIAKKLYITECTVKKHVSQVLAKLELADRTQAALYARQKKITA